MARATPTIDEIERLIEHGWFLVLDRAAGGLAGVVHVQLARGIGRIDHLSMASDLRSRWLGARLLGAADALCAAFHCAPEVDLAARRAA